VKRPIIIASALVFSSCGQSDDTNKALESADEGPPIVQLSDNDRSRVCRAAIADVNGHPPKILSLVSDNGETVRVKYSRPSDGKVWTNECRFDGDRIVWRTVDAFGPDSGLGRWRDGPHDETIIYSISEQEITLKTSYPDNSGSSETYTVQ